MNHIRFTKTNVQLGAGLVALAGLLTYTFAHTGALLSGYVQPAWVGYLAALGIELAVVSLSLRIGELRQSGQNPAFFLSVLVAVVVVSALANVAEGFEVARGELLTVQSVQQLDPLQAIIGLSATGLVSLIVLAMSELIGTDVRAAVNLAERERRRAERRSVQVDRADVSTTEENASLEQARIAKAKQDATTKAERLNAMLDIYRNDPNAGPTDVARALNVSRTTVYGYLSELQNNGRIHANGNGVRVLD